MLAFFPSHHHSFYNPYGGEGAKDKILSRDQKMKSTNTCIAILVATFLTERFASGKLENMSRSQINTKLTFLICISGFVRSQSHKCMRSWSLLPATSKDRKGVDGTKAKRRNNGSTSRPRKNSNSISKKQANIEKLKDLNLGQVVKGEVVSIKPFGVFVRLNYKHKVDALLHKSQISNEIIEDVSDHFAVGQSIDARVIRIDFEKGDVGISTRPRRPDRYPIDEFREMVGEVVQGRVKSVKEYGAFIDIGCQKIDGLLHKSRISDNKVERVEDFVKVNDIVNVRLYRVDPKKKIIELSMRSHESDQYHDKKREMKKRWNKIAEEVASL